MMDDQCSNFQTKSHGKWILAGEHTVLRGGPALVFPTPHKFIELFYSPHPTTALEVDFNMPLTHSHNETFLMLFWGVFEESLKLLHKKHADILGRLSFRNTIPLGAGLGFSAAFCVSLTRFFQWKKWLNASDAFEFARLLENHFHGKSSGVDIAGSLYDCGMHFQMKDTALPELHSIKLNWRPHLYLSYSGHISVTSKCINLVNELWESQPEYAKKIDQTMINSVELAEQALQGESQTALVQLQKAINLAQQCFSEWGLINQSLLEHLSVLKQHGALAAKPTGAGDGGYVLSLWDKMPDVSCEMIPVF